MDHLDEFLINREANSIAPSIEFEGMNAFRFAIAGTLWGWNPESEIQPSGVVSNENLEDFGFPTDLLSQINPEPLTQQIRRGVQFCKENHQEWNSDNARIQTWREISEGKELAAVFSFLISGICSQFERESVAAAVALFNSMPLVEGEQSEINPRRWRLWFNRPWAAPFFFHEKWMHPSVSFNEERNEEELIEWQGKKWAEYCNRWVKYALASGTEWEIVGCARLLAR